MIKNDQDFACSCPPSSVADRSAASFSSSSPTLLWENQSRKWNGFDSWSAKVEDYIKTGFVQLFSKPGFSKAVPNFQVYAESQREGLTQYDDGELMVTTGQLYNVVDQAAAYRRLQEETAFTIPDFVLIVDPRVPGKGFLAVEKVECTDGKALEYQLTGENADDCMNLIHEINALLDQAREVLVDEFFVDLDNPGCWGLTAQGLARARARLPLTQSDLVMLRPVQ
jgi:hypothetical protein